MTKKHISWFVLVADFYLSVVTTSMLQAVYKTNELISQHKECVTMRWRNC